MPRLAHWQPKRDDRRLALMRIFASLCLLLTMSLPALAQQGNVPLPRPRPVESVAPVPADPPKAVEESTGPTIPLPRKRPDPDAKPQSPAPVTPPVDATTEDHVVPPEVEPQEAPKPPRVYQSACPAVLLGQVEAKAMPPIADNQCGAQSPLSLTAVLANGRMVPVSGGVTTTCGMASALPGWIEAIDSYLFAKENTRIAEVMVGTSYMCRNVNNASEGDLSFHAFADAMDVIGFKLEDGRTVTVESGWGDALSAEGRLLRFAHDNACAHFTTTLGPEANALHRDHLHIDLGCHGKTCTARMCE
jgi:hypothetical protein